VLRDDPEASQLAPQPDLAAVPGLVERFRGAGLTVDHRVDGIARAVPPAVGLTAFRVVQESLTNVLHHVGPTRVTVTTTYATGLVGIVVVNEPGEHRPPPAPRATHGLGLLGMRERVALLGGRMAAGPTPGGGFEVRVELPDSAAASQAVPAPWGVPDAGPEAGMAGWRP
jgi:signal transduction histidine kinase